MLPSSSSTSKMMFLLLASLLQANGVQAAFGDLGRPYWIAHGTLMFLSWGVVFPLGALMAVYRKYVGNQASESSWAVFRWMPNFYLPHLYFQVTGIVMNIVAFIMAARGCQLEYGTWNPFDDVLWKFNPAAYPWNHHVKWGVSILILLVSYCFFAYFAYFVSCMFFSTRR